MKGTTVTVEATTIAGKTVCWTKKNTSGILNIYKSML